MSGGRQRRDEVPAPAETRDQTVFLQGVGARALHAQPIQGRHAGRGGEVAVRAAATQRQATTALTPAAWWLGLSSTSRAIGISSRIAPIPPPTADHRIDASLGERRQCVQS